MRRPPTWLGVVQAGAALGLVFAAVSTYDFVQHLDRQVHSLHCSFILGASHTGESGCQVAMMSPYSSVLRGQVWGGVPISLPAMSVFAFLMLLSADLLLTRRKDDPRATGFLALATALPAATSLVMLVISLTQLGTACKLCVGIYLASAACLVGGIAQWRQAVAGRRSGEVPVPGPHGEPAFVGRARSSSGARLVAIDGEPASTGFLATAFAIGVGFVALPVALYLAMAPDHSRFIGTCEALPRPDDSYGVMVRMARGGAGGAPAPAPAIEVLDPLCPACKAFEQRLAGSGLAPRLDRKAVLFPLDNTCNWMVTEATHPGACTVSEAVLCAGERAPEVIAWAFEVQDRIRSEARADPGAAARIVKQKFPELASCVGSPEARSRLNKSLRWIVANNIRVLTPQLFIDKVKLCDEDVDLGLEYMLSNMLDRRAHGTLAPVPLEKPGATPAPADRPADRPTDKPAPPSHRSATTGADRASGGESAGKTEDKTSGDKASGDKASGDKASGDKASGDKAGGGATDHPVTDPSEAPSGRAPAESPASKPGAGSPGRPAEGPGAGTDDSVPVAPPAGSADKPAGKRGDIELPSPERGSGGQP